MTWLEIALACPACADKTSGGLMYGLALAAFIFFPFAVAAVALRVVRRADALERGNR